MTPAGNRRAQWYLDGKTIEHTDKGKTDLRRGGKNPAVTAGHTGKGKTDLRRNGMTPAVTAGHGDEDSTGEPPSIGKKRKGTRILIINRKGKGLWKRK